MDRDEVIRLAREAGFHEWYTLPEIHPEHVAIVERFAALVAAQEREMCAKACDEEAKRAYQNDGLDDGYEAGKSVAAKNCANAIRARSNNGN